MSTLNVKQRWLVFLVLVMLLAGGGFGGAAPQKEAEAEAKVVTGSDTALGGEATWSKKPDQALWKKW
jgi:hypothetical protein